MDEKQTAADCVVCVDHTILLRKNNALIIITKYIYIFLQ